MVVSLKPIWRSGSSSNVLLNVAQYLCCGVCGPTDLTGWGTFSGDVRNDLYLTLERGDFERGGKSVQKNVEVTVYVIYADGEILKVRTHHWPAGGAVTGRG